MRVAVLMHGGISRDGADKVIPSFVWLLERLGRRHDVHVFTFNQEYEPANWDVVGVHVHNVGPGLGWRLRLAAQFAKMHRRQPFQVIHGFFGWGGTYAAALGWRHHLPVLFHAAGGEFVALADIEYGMQRSVRDRLEVRIAAVGANRVSGASGYQQRLAYNIGIDAEHVPIGVALDQWPVSAPRRRDPSTPARLLHVGDLRPVKDQPTLLAAAVMMRDRGLEFELDIAGYDTMNGASARSPDALDLGLSVRWHGRLDRERLRALVDASDVLLMTSRHEAGPLVVLEAAIAGVPTVGTRVGHVADWSPDAAIAVDVGDAVALARETKALLEDEPRRMAIAREAQRRAIDIDADFTASTFERMYRELCA